MKQNNFNSKLGFLFSAIGGAVGLGNIWMFPHKLQKYGGMFLYTYLLLTITVGVALLTLEFILGKYFRSDVMQLYRVNAPKIKSVGILTVVSPLIILMYYCAAGGMCLKYLLDNFFAVFSMNIFISNSMTFVFTVVFIFWIYIIASKDIDKGIERFNKITVPVLMVAIFLWAGILLFRDNTNIILKEMLALKIKHSYKEYIEIFAVSAEQMFFSLSIAVGSMITYGAMMPDTQNTLKSALIVSAADTLFAVAMSVVVISASITHSFDANGPQLIFGTMQNVFDNNGILGNLLGSFFYMAIIVAALTSAVSYVEVPVSAMNSISTFNRKKSLSFCLGIILLPAIYITIENFQVFYRVIAFIGEGFIVPITAFLSSLNFGVFDSKQNISFFIEKEIHNVIIRRIFTFLLKYLVELVIITVIIFQTMIFCV